MFIVFSFLAIPCLVNLINHFLSESLVFLLFTLFILLVLHNKNFFAVVVLALIPFVRQNFLPLSFLLFYFYLFKPQRKNFKIFYSLVFVLLILLPVYHNYFYNGTFTFFVKYHTPQALVTFDLNNPKIGDVLFGVFQKITMYSGLNYWFFNWNELLQAFPVLPFGCFLILFLGKQDKSSAITTLVCLGVVFFPTLILGGAYYPRFELLNIYVTLLVLLLQKIKNPYVTTIKTHVLD
jgi:hypothetical protein